MTWATDLSPFYLLAPGLGPLLVGIVATEALLGSALLTLAVGVLGAKYGRRQLLLATARLMITTGLLFAVIHDYAVLVIVALLAR